MTLGQFLLCARLDRRMSLAQMRPAVMVGSIKTDLDLQSFERDERIPHANTLKKLAIAYGLDYVELSGFRHAALAERRAKRRAVVKRVNSTGKVEMTCPLCDTVLTEL